MVVVGDSLNHSLLRCSLRGGAGLEPVKALPAVDGDEADATAEGDMLRIFFTEGTSLGKVLAIHNYASICNTINC